MNNDGTTKTSHLTLEQFQYHTFSSGSTIGKDYKSFSTKYRNRLKKIFPDCTIVFSNNHYCFSGFISKNEKHVYFSISDVRYFKNAWFKNILIRTAKHTKDYTGGSNCYSHFDNIRSKVLRLLSL
jgi:hypothetical protein